MKTTLLVAALLCANFFSAKAQPTGACQIVSITTQFISSQPSARFPGKCDVKVNLSWEQIANNGNKFSYVHVWQASKYQAFNFTNPANPPMAADLAATVGTIVVADPSSATPTLYRGYNPDQNYTKVLPLTGYAPLTLRRTTHNNVDRFTVEGVVLAGVDCNNSGIYSFIVDVWSSQQSQGKNVHCVGQNNRFTVNEIVDRSQIMCGSTSTVQVQLASNTAATTGTYKVFADLSAFGSFDPAADAVLATANFATGATPSLGGSWMYNYTSTVTVPTTYRRSNIWLEVTPGGGKAKQLYMLSNGCAPLPENLASFTATRVRNNVQLKWQTVNEQNSRGFNVLRKTSGAWETVAFVPSNSGGNSSDKTSYEYTDANAFSGASQYQLAEVTNQGRPKLSEIRAVKGESQAGKIILFPNPSANGRATLVFDNNTARDISVLDAAGRPVKEYTATVAASVSFDNLPAGFYTVRIRVRATNELFTEKLLVAKR